MNKNLILTMLSLSYNVNDLFYNKILFVFTFIPENLTVYGLSVFHHIKNPPRYLLPSVPEDLLNKIRRFHGNPDSWWFGQFVLYVTRPNESMRNQSEEKIKELGFQNPIVG